MKRHKILIIDDIPDNIKVLQAILSSENYDISYALNGKDALILCISHSYDLILLDIMMPEMDGYEVCKCLKAKDKTRDIPVIFLTAKVDKESIVKGFEVGAQDYVTKPFNSRELMARVRTQLDLKIKNESLKFMNLQLEERVAARTMELQEMNKSLHEANSRLETLEDAKNDFLSLMSNELREPLNGIVGFADMLEFSVKNKTHLKYIRYIKQASENLIEVSDMALLLSALRCDRYHMTSESYSIKGLVEHAISSARERATERRISVDMNIAQDIQIKGDVRLLEMSLVKMLENAIEFAPVRSVVKIKTDMEGRKVKLSFCDDGPAFTSSEVDYVFRFFNADKGEAITDFERYSPGLVVVKLVMALHNATVDIKNLTDGGVCVNFMLPVGE